MSDKRFNTLLAVSVFIVVFGAWVALVITKILQPTGLEKALTGGAALAGGVLFHALGRMTSGSSSASSQIPLPTTEAKNG